MRKKIERASVLSPKKTTRQKNPLFQKNQKPATAQLFRIVLSDIGAGLGIVCGILFLIWYTTIHSSFFYLTDVTVESTEYVPHDELVTLVDEYLNERRLFVFPSRSIFYASSTEIERRILDQFGSTYALEHVTITKDFPRALSVRVNERVPAVVWTTQGSVNNAYYLVDRDGIVTQFVAQAETFPANLPRITDAQRTTFAIDERATSQRYIAYLLDAYEQFKQYTQLDLRYFEFPLITCQELQYVMEQIFEDEIEGAASDEFKQKKLDIQTRFKNGELTIDQSLDALDAIKREEISAKGNTNSASPKVRWQQVSVTVPCDYGAVSKELHIVTGTEKNEFRVYLDIQLDLAAQLRNFTSAQQAKTIDLEKLMYFDARYMDRAYYKEK